MRREHGRRTGALVVFFLAFLTSTLNAQDPSLVLYFSFDDDLGNEARDHSQFRNNGTIEGRPQSVGGKFGSALMFDATDDQVVVSTNETLEIRDQITLMVWVRPGPNLTADWRNIVGKSPTNVLGNNTFSYSIRSDNSGALRFSLNLGGWQYVLGPTLVQDTWYHITGTYDGTRLTLYVDAKSAGTTQASGKINVVTDPVCIGNLVNAAGASQNEYWSGVIDEVRIWNRALAEDEVKRNMELGKEGVAAPMPFAWRPEPADGAIHASTWVTLRWSPGDLAVSHNVYLGDNFDDVNNGTGDTFRGNQTATFYVAGFPGFAYPQGLVPGTRYYWRIDEVNEAEPDSPWKGNVWSFWVPPNKAYEPDPVDGAKFVDWDVTLRWTIGMNAKLHHVYFGQDAAEVEMGAASTYKGTAPAATYNCGTLNSGQLYYWRIDEFDGVATHKGDVWSFTTKPLVPITEPNLACWWTLDEGIGTTVLDWSGHGHDGTVRGHAEWVDGYDGSALHFGAGAGAYVVHSLGAATDWAAGTVALWVKADTLGQDEFSSAFSSHLPNTAGFQIDVDGGNPGLYRVNPGGLLFGTVTTAWVHLALSFEGTSATLYYNGDPAASGILTDTTFNQFAININRNATNYMDGTIDDVRIYDKVLTADEIKLVMRLDPLLAWKPSPADGVTVDIEIATPLSWSPGDKASQHEVYLGADKDGVATADSSDTTGIYRGRQSGTSYTPPEGVEWGGGPYYWRIDENNNDGTVTKGRIWTFTVADFRLIDDFESYDAGGNEIWWSWKDGLGYGAHDNEPAYPGNGTGSAVGDENTGSYTEETIVHGGGQSMPLWYDNNKQGFAKYSEVEFKLTAPRDWSKYGVGELSLWFRGYPGSVGSFVESPVGTFTMTGSGVDIWGTADQFHFAYKTLTGAGSIIAKVESVANTNAWAKAGVMIRETLDAGSKHAFACVTPANGVAFQGRTGANAASFSTNQTGLAAPYWVKLERDAAGNFAVSHSANGTTWQPVTNAVPQNIPMSSVVSIGLALTSHDAAQTYQAKFSNVSTTGTISPQWAHQDVGISSNAPEPLYVAVSNSTGQPAVVVHPDPAAAATTTWTEWVIPLSAFSDKGVNLANVDRLAIGLGTRGNQITPGGSGKMYFDDIRLYQPRTAP